MANQTELLFDKWQDASGVNRKTIIQTKHYHYTTNSDSYISFADSYYDVPWSFTFTPKRSDSLLYIYSIDQIRAINSLGVAYGISRDGSRIAGSYHNGGTNLDFYYKGSEVNHHRNLNAKVVVPANSTNATTFRPWMISWSSGTAEFSNGHGTHQMLILEIAQ